MFPSCFHAKPFVNPSPGVLVAIPVMPLNELKKSVFRTLLSRSKNVFHLVLTLSPALSGWSQINFTTLERLLIWHKVPETKAAEEGWITQWFLIEALLQLTDHSGGCGSNVEGKL